MNAKIQAVKCQACVSPLPQPRAVQERAVLQRRGSRSVPGTAPPPPMLSPTPIPKDALPFGILDIACSYRTYAGTQSCFANPHMRSPG